MSQEQQKIQKYIIKSAPYGELTDVIQDLMKLFPINLLSPVISKAIEDYSEDHLVLFPYSGTYFAIMQCNKVEPGMYIDQLNKKIVTVDYLKGELLKIEDTTLKLADPVEKLLRHLSEAISNYVNKYYKQPYGSQVFMHVGNNLEVHIGFTSKNIQLANFYSGQWISKWKINKDSIQGIVTIKAHFFESGNVQLNQKRHLNKEFKFKQDMSENAKNIIKIISEFECEVQSYLSDLYQNLPNSLFKKLRRVAPLTKTKMVWNINSIQLYRNLMGINK